MFCPPRAAIGAGGQPHTKLAVRRAQRAHRERERLEALFDAMNFTIAPSGQLEMFQ